MVARAWGNEKGRSSRGPSARAVTAKGEASAKATAAAGVIEEHFVQNQAVSVRLLVNRRARTMRVVDFRAGPSQAKRSFVLRFAREQQIEKVYTLVERDEVSTWIKMGFSKEGNIPGFYKRSDAFLLGCVVKSAPLDMHVPEGEGGAEDDDDAADPDAPATPAAVAAREAHDRAEKLLVQAKKAAKDVGDKLPVPKLAELREADARRAVDKAIRAGRALTAFEPFGRDVERAYFSVTARGGFELVASRESQSCFGNAFLEILTAPATDAERLGTVVALRALGEHLLAHGVVSVFALSPSDDLGLAAAFVHNGFRRTGLLLGHLSVGGKRKDALVWSKKLANPDDA